MPRGPRKHLKRLFAPSHWMLSKLGGVFAPRPSAGPHKARECIPLLLLVRNRLKYALNSREVTNILAERTLKVDNKVRTDPCFPAGFMDVITIEKTGDRFRLLFDTKGRFVLKKIGQEEAKFKLAKVTKTFIAAKGIPYLSTNDSRTIRFPDPLIKKDDTVKIDLSTGKIVDHVKFDVGNLATCNGGHNLGRVGIIVKKEKHHGSFDIIHIKDSVGQTFSTRAGNVFVIGKGTKSLVGLPKAKGIKRTVLAEYELNKKKEEQQ